MLPLLSILLVKFWESIPSPGFSLYLFILASQKNKKKKRTAYRWAAVQKKSGFLSAKIARDYILDLQPVFNTNFAKLFLSLLSKTPGAL